MGQNQQRGWATCGWSWTVNQRLWFLVSSPVFLVRGCRCTQQEGRTGAQRSGKEGLTRSYMCKAHSAHCPRDPHSRCVCEGMDMGPTVCVQRAQRTSQKLGSDTTPSPLNREFAFLPWLCAIDVRIAVFGYLVSSGISQAAGQWLSRSHPTSRTWLPPWNNHLHSYGCLQRPFLAGITAQAVTTKQQFSPTSC